MFSLAGGRPRWFWCWWDNQSKYVRDAVVFVVTMALAFFLSSYIR
jgi:hypothetical protein